MRITKVEALVSATRPPFVYAKVSTSNGLVGYGECEHMFEYAPPENFTTSIEALGKYVVGMDPFDTELAWYTLTQTFHMWNAQGNLGAIGAIDTALLDIKGKALNTPVYNLLGGKFRDKVRLYCHILEGSGGERKDERERKTTPETIAEGAKEQVRHGFTVLKFDPFTIVYWEEIDDPQISAQGVVRSARFQRDFGMNYPRKLVPRAIELVKAVRDAVGPKVDICLDIHGRFDVESAVRIGRLLEPYDLFFYEEPIPPGNIEALRYVRQRVNIPICVGERRYFVDEFRRLFELEATDIIMPDTCRMGLSWVKKISDMALIYHVPVAPHVVNSSPLNAVIAAHACASIPNFLISESMGPQRLELYKDLLKPQILPENGYLRVPDKPGLGVELNEDNLTKEYDTLE
ncbi:MAG: mandelate racemase/muconate lactonizing enzyme family protein [Nitrososphaeria archaeon]|jgi:galactonate dehydratase